MRKILAFVATLAIALAGFSAPAQASTPDKTTTSTVKKHPHSSGKPDRIVLPPHFTKDNVKRPTTSKNGSKVIKPMNKDYRAKAWQALDRKFEKSPKTKRSFMKQGNMISAVGFAKHPNNTYPLRSIKTKNHGGGYYVFAVAPADHFINLTDAQFKALTKTLLPCRYEDSVNCFWDGTKRGNKKGDKIVNIPNNIMIAKTKVYG